MIVAAGRADEEGAAVRSERAGRMHSSKTSGRMEANSSRTTKLRPLPRRESGLSAPRREIVASFGRKMVSSDSKGLRDQKGLVIFLRRRQAMRLARVAGGGDVPDGGVFCLESGGEKGG